MNASSSSAAPFVWRGYTALRWAVLILTGVTLFRFWLTTRLELVPDEAYYWLWSENLALSYRDKGPLIGWTIALSTWLFGDTVFAIRFFAVVLGTGIGWQLFRLARRLYDDQTALWCLLLANIIPLFVVGSILMTIDSLSVFSWAWAANVLWTALHSGKTRHWIGLGLIIGFGFLAKFTNGVQLACIGLFLLWSKPHRSLIFSRHTIAMSIAFLFCIAPIVYWNMQTGWVHAMALHSRSGVEDTFQIRPKEILQFLGGELGVLSPLIAIGMAWAALATLRKHFQEPRAQFLLSQCIPLVGLFTFFSLNKAGKENWIAPALITGLVVTVVFWRERVARDPRWRRAVWPALGLATLMTLGLHFLVLNQTPYLRLPAKLDPLRRAQGWADFTRHVQEARVKYGANILIGSHYSPASMMAYSLPDRPTTYLPRERYGKSQFSLWPSYELKPDSRALFVAHSVRPLPAALTNDFPKCELVEDFYSQHQGRDMNRFRLFLCTREGAPAKP